MASSEHFLGNKNLANKIVTDEEKLVQVAQALRSLGFRIVMTIGSWDLLHIGHVRYLNKAKEYGDILIVGADSDAAVKRYKGELRPIIPQAERLEMLSYQSCVDFATLIEDVDDHGNWQYGLLTKIHPDVFIAIDESYPEDQLSDIRARCGEVVVLPRQAENTSTSKLIQEAFKKHMLGMLAAMDEMK